MHIGLVVDGTDHFLRPIEKALGESHSVERFSPRFVRLPFIGKRVNDGLLKYQLQKFINTHDVTLFEWAASLLVVASNLSLKRPIVTRLHLHELVVAVSDINWSSVDSIILLTKAMQKRFELLVEASPPVYIINNGVDLKKFSPVPREYKYRLGVVATLRPVKRIYDLILAVYELRQQGYPFTLKIAGGKDQTDWQTQAYSWAMQELIERLNMQSIVTFDEHVENVSDWLSEVDVFISNSFWEGQQVALLEAMASGCYCLSHCWAGVEEILPEENIYVTEADLCRKLVEYSAMDVPMRISLQQRMRSIAEERYDEQRMVEQIVSLLERTAQGHAAGE